MFLGQLDKPDVDSIEGLSPSISIDQKTTSKNPRSTVGTVTEIYDYLRLLYARCGTPHCPVCGKEITSQTVDQIIDRIMELPDRTKFLILAPVVRAKKGRHEKTIEAAKKGGFVRIRVDGSMYDLGETIELDKNKKHTVEIVVDRMVKRDGIRDRLGDSVETALSLAEGNLTVALLGDDGAEGEELTFSQNYACEEHGISVTALEPRMFSFNNPAGACPECAGLGEKRIISFDRVAPDRSLSLRGGAIQCNGFKSNMDESGWNGPLFIAVGKKHGFDLDMPLSEYSPEALHALAYGTGDELYYVERVFDGVVHRNNVKFPGVIGIIQARFDQSQDEYYEQFVEDIVCHSCHGDRLRPEILSVTVGGKNIIELCRMPIRDEIEFFDNLTFDAAREPIAREILKEIRSRLHFLGTVGLEYLDLARKAGTLSGGEAQRIRLATQIGSSLIGVLYVLDEPSIGLHQRDNGKLITALKNLRDMGNSVIVVEHDEETMLESDYIVDIGPGAGIHGGEIVAAGTPAEVAANTASITGDYLSGRRQIAVPSKRRSGSGEYVTVYGAAEHNLRGINVRFPLGKFICVTGVSGSGKSSLVNSILYPVLAHELNRATTFAGKYDRIEGIENLDKVICIDQSPIGRTPRSNPATYTGVFTDIRNLFAETQDARKRGFKPGRFSFNVKGGRCEACEGDGVKKIEMHFLPDVYVTCDVCKGHRYNRDTLEVRYKGKNISEVLDMTAEEGLEFFSALPSIERKLRAMCEVGLGYVKLGQSSTTLSGGEAQRVKLASELAKRATGRTFYLLDEPTTGLHTADVAKLIDVLQRLVDAGNTVLVIEHNLDLIKTADHIIDLGPDGGDGGGSVVVCGTPEEVARCPESFTGQFLREKLGMKKA